MRCIIKTVLKLHYAGPATQEQHKVNKILHRISQNKTCYCHCSVLKKNIYCELLTVQCP